MDLDADGETHGLTAIEPGALEIGEDVQFLHAFSRADEEVARPCHGDAIVCSRGRRLDRASTQISRSGEGVNRSVERADFQFSLRGQFAPGSPALRSALDRSAGCPP